MISRRIVGVAVALAALFVVNARAYPGGTPSFQTDAAPYCASCHSSRDAAVLAGACAEVLERHKAIRDAMEAGKQDLSKLFGALETEINKHSSDLRKFAGL